MSDPVSSICSYPSNIFENYFTHLHHLQPGDSSPGRLSTARWQRWHHLDSLASWKVQVKVHTISFWFTLNYDKFFTESCKIVFHYFLWIHIITALTEFLIWNEKYLKYFSDLWWQTLLWSDDCVELCSQVWIFSVVSARSGADHGIMCDRSSLVTGLIIHMAKVGAEVGDTTLYTALSWMNYQRW